MIVILELLVLSSLLCVLHAYRDRMGMAPLYLILGLLEAFLFFLTKSDANIAVELYSGHSVNLAYSLALPLILAVMLVVYILDGTREAQRLLVGLMVLYLVHGVLDMLVHYHALHPPEPPALPANHPLIQYSWRSRLSSLVAFGADAIVCISVYQVLVNRFSLKRHAIPLYIGYVAAMITDGVVYGVLMAFELPSAESLLIVEKLLVALVAAIPVVIYLEVQLQRHATEVKSGQIARSPFDILDWRRRAREAERKLKEQRAQFLMIKDSFSRYVPPEVVDAIIEDPGRLELGGEMREVTVLFADIRGYSTLSEKLAPTEIIQLLNRYFATVTGVIFANQGMINEFEGDGILAVFGAPLPLAAHADSGLRAAIGMLQAVDRLNAESEADGSDALWKDVGLDRFSIRIGLHSGTVVAGNIGTPERIKYAVIGDTVNTASRLEGLNKALNTELLLSQACVDHLRSPELFELDDRGEHAVKGRKQQVHVFTLTPEARETTYGSPSALILPGG